MPITLQLLSMRAIIMNENYFAFFEDIDQALVGKFGSIDLGLKIVGFAALALSGLTERGTKDIDALKTKVFEGLQGTGIVDFLTVEFGKGSVGALRHGVYLDFVPQEIIWLPPYPRFIQEQRFACIDVQRLHPVDVCVSKTFSNFQRLKDRANDRMDIIHALNEKIIAFEEYARLIGESLPCYECHAQAPEVFPRVLKFIEELQPLYGPAPFHYSPPNWMENV